jgi:prepilin-type N-terminal cleavage/methylation domain-containing protein
MRSVQTSSGFERGFTLVELIVAMALIGIMFSMGAGLISQNMTNTLMVDAGQSSLDRTRYALGRVSRELREIQYSSGSGSYSITSLSSNATTITFTRFIGGVSNSVTIARSGNVLNLSYLPIGGSVTTSALVGNVSGFTLDFFDGDGAATTSSADVRSIQVTLSTLDATSGQSISERMRVALRNS